MFKLRFITRQHLEGLYRPQCRLQQPLQPGADHHEESKDNNQNHEEHRRTIPPPYQNLPLAQTLHIGALLAVGYNFVHGCLQSKRLREKTKVDLPYSCPIVLWRSFYATPTSRTPQYSPSVALQALPRVKRFTSSTTKPNEPEGNVPPKNVDNKPPPVFPVNLPDLPEYTVDVTYQEETKSGEEESKPASPVNQVEEAFNELVQIQHDIVGRLGNLHGVDLLTSGSAEEGVALLEMAASEGNPASLYNLGVAYENGLGGRTKDPTIALRFYRRASGLGHPTAKFNLAVFYHQGLAGLHKNKKIAKRLMMEACQGGQKEACRILGIRVPEESPKRTNDIDENESPPIFSMPDVVGGAEEVFRTARAHHFGLSGMPEDPHFALELYRTAAEQGHEKAEMAFEKLYRELNPPELDLSPNRSSEDTLLPSQKSLRVSESSPSLSSTPELLPLKLRRMSKSLLHLEELSLGDSGVDRRWELECRTKN